MGVAGVLQEAGDAYSGAPKCELNENYPHTFTPI